MLQHVSPDLPSVSSSRPYRVLGFVAIALFLRASPAIRKRGHLRWLARTLKGSMRNARLLGAAMACARVPAFANTSPYVAPNTSPFGISHLPFQTPRSLLSNDRFSFSKESPIDAETSGWTTMKLGFESEGRSEVQAREATEGEEICIYTEQSDLNRDTCP